MRRTGLRAPVGACLVALLTAAASTPGPAYAAARNCGGERATIVGTSGDDILVGTDRADVIWAGDGDDVVRAGRGADLVCGGRGADRLVGDEGRDRLLGGGGDDVLDGGPGDDDLDGGAGVDQLRLRSDVGGTVNLVVGRAGGDGDDALSAIEALLTSGLGSYTVYTGPTTVSVRITGSHRDRIVTPETGTSGTPLTLAAGDGDDTYLVGQPGVTVVEDAPDSAGRDQIDVLTDGRTVIRDGAGGVRIDATGGGSEDITVVGAAGATYLLTGGGDDVVRLDLAGGSAYVDTGAGSDLLSGRLPAVATVSLGSGDDLLTEVQTASADPVRGGSGLDTVVGGPDRDVIRLGRGRWAGSDGTVRLAGFNRALGAGGDDLLAGSSGRDWLLGGPGADELGGRGGSDVLLGGTGVDRADGGNGDDVCRAEARTACERRREE